MFDKNYLKRKEWIWILILLFGGIALFFALCVDMRKTEIGNVIDIICTANIRNILWQASETICTTIVTYSTMLAAIVIFFYSMIDNKRLGVPYRQLIAYTVGSHTIPVLFMTTLLLTVFMIVVRCIPLKYTAYMCAIYILIIQVFVIIEILLSTSYKHCKRVICRIERKRYIAGIGSKDEFNTEWAYFYGHLERAIHSEEFIPDKKGLLMEFLWIPFHRKTGKLYKKVNSKKRLTEMEELERIYQFYFVNILSAFQDFNGEAKHLERNQLYMCIKDFVLELLEKNSEYMKSDERIQYAFHMVLSGITNGLISSNVEDKDGCCNFILSRCKLNKDIYRRQVYLFVLFQEMLSMIDTQIISSYIKIRNLVEWEPIKVRDIGFYAEFWQIWAKMYDIPFRKKVRHFDMAMQTMSGRQNMSVAITKMMLTMIEKDSVKEKNNGEVYINKNTAVEK